MEIVGPLWYATWINISQKKIISFLSRDLFTLNNDIHKRLPGVEILVSVRSHLFMNPIQHISDFGVDAKVLWARTSFAPACGAFDVPLAAIFAHQRTATVPLTRINSSLIMTCAQH